MKAKILYIEDNEQNFYLVNFILTSKGHEVIWAKDGQEGIEMATSVRADLILLDIQLPVMDGYTVARALRANPGLLATPVVALTSHAMAGDREKAMQVGCTGYIEKPINPVTFVEQIETYLASADARVP